MKYPRFLIVFLLLCLLVGNLFSQSKSSSKTTIKTGKTPKAVSSSNGGWDEFTSLEGSYKILLPAKPINKISEEVNNGIILRTVSEKLSLTEIGFSVSFTDAISKQKLNEKSTLESMKDLISQDRKVIRKTPITLNEIHGYEIIFERDGRNIVIHRVYVTGNRWYELIASYDLNDKESFSSSFARNKVKLDRFFKSFQLQK